MQKTLFFLLFLPFTAFAQLFPYDLSFNNIGYNIQDIDAEDYVHSVLIQPDEKIIISGTTQNWGTDEADVFLIRFNANGQLDSTFGNGGKVLLNYDYESPSYCLAKLQTDGKIVITFNTYIDLICRRFLSDGTVDNSFGNNGVFIFPMNNPPYDNDNLYARDLDLQSDGKVVITAENFTSPTFITLFRLNANGVLDNTFGNSSTTDYATSSSDSEFASIESIIVNDNIINLSGSFNSSSAFANTILVRQFNSNGSLYNSFGTNGRLRINDIPSHLSLHKMDNKFGVAYRNPNESHQSVVRLFNLNGTAINGFGQSGVMYYSHGLISDIREDSNGKIVIVAQAQEVNNQRAMIVSRHHSDGTLDSTFAQNGLYINPLAPNHITYTHVIELTNTDAIIAAGNTKGLFSLGNDAFVAKFLPNLTVNTKAIQKSNLQPKVFPNPVQDNLILQYNLEQKTNLLIELYDINGQLIKVLSNQVESLGKRQKEWNIGDLQTGFYFLYLKSESEQITLKIFKK